MYIIYIDGDVYTRSFAVLDGFRHAQNAVDPLRYRKDVVRATSSNRPNGAGDLATPGPGAYMLASKARRLKVECHI